MERFLLEWARHEAPRVETWTIRLKIGLRIFLDLRKRPEGSCCCCRGGLTPPQWLLLLGGGDPPLLWAWCCWGG